MKKSDLSSTIKGFFLSLILDNRCRYNNPYKKESNAMKEKDKTVD